MRIARAAVLLGLFVVCAAAAAAPALPISSTSSASRTSSAPSAAPVIVVPVDGAIGPASADFIVRGLADAAREHAALAIIQLDTPGGLDTSMRQIIKAILASPVPVAAFVAPGGARAASAGTYIVYASHVAAMAPGTNLGAASPVQLGLGGAGGSPVGPSASPASSASSGKAASGPAALPMDSTSTEARKTLHDAVAYITSLAQLRGRNAEWAARAVREAVSLTATDALAQHVIDVIANDPADLARKLNARVVTTVSGVHRLDTAGSPIVTLAPDWRNRFLAVVADPNVALILLTLGMYGLFFEFANPGFVLPGVTGAICMLIGLFALQLLPINYAGLALVALGLAFLIAEAFVPTSGVLGFGGLAAFAIGALMLIKPDVPGFGIPWPLIVGLVSMGALLVFTMSSVVLRARQRPVVSGGDALVGSIGEVLDEGLLRAEPTPGNPSATPPAAPAAGWVRVHGERWRVASDASVPAGRRVRVTGRHGLTLTVTPLDDPPAAGRLADKGEQP